MYLFQNCVSFRELLLVTKKLVSTLITIGKSMECNRSLRITYRDKLYLSNGGTRVLIYL